MKKTENGIVVMTVGGVGYKIFVKPNSVDDFDLCKEYKILTHMIVREDIMDLYGFINEDERQLFLQFLSVSGIGPKSALHLLSLGTVEEIGGAISRGDVDYLTQVAGVGKKTAERIVVELRSKIANLKFKISDDGMDSGALGDVMEGLVSLGYSAQQAREVIKKLDGKNKSSEELMREALRNIN